MAVVKRAQFHQNMALVLIVHRHYNIIYMISRPPLHNNNNNNYYYLKLFNAFISFFIRVRACYKII